MFHFEVGNADKFAREWSFEIDLLFGWHRRNRRGLLRLAARVRAKNDQRGNPKDPRKETRLNKMSPHQNKGVILRGWKYAAFLGVIVGAVGLTIYPVIISPMIDPEPWKKMSREARQKAGIKQEDIQPGNMKVWSDPFDRPGKPGNK